MPFDGLNQGLAERLSWSGIVPVSKDVLEAHKAAEVAKHPGHFDLAISGMFAASFAVSFSAVAFVAFSEPERLPSQIVAILLLGVPLSFVTLLLFATVGMAIKVKGPARWRQSFYIDQPVPEPIWALAQEARRQNPGAYLVIGELIQDRVVLDPYLMLCEGNDRVCLGIWDGETIIAMADRREP